MCLQIGPSSMRYLPILILANRCAALLPSSAAVLLSMLIAAHAEKGNEGNMRFPQASKQATERKFVGDDESHRRCLNYVRREIAVLRNADLESEDVSWSEEFGEIYRYNVFQQLEDSDGNSQQVKSILVVWTKDCAKFGEIIYPTLRLP